MESAELSFGSINKITDEPDGDTIFHGVTLIAEGTWTDGHSKTPTQYLGNDLEKMRFEKMTMKMDHDIFGTLPITNEIGIIENPKFVRDPIAKWLGDVRIFPTQNGTDTAILLRRGQITDISSELFLKPVTNSKSKTVATDMIFMGAATVRQGACTICKFNEGITMTDENDPKQNAPEEGDPAPDEKTSTDPDIAALEAAVKVKEAMNAAHIANELKIAHATIAELKTANTALEARLIALEKDTRVKELQKKLDVMASTPVVHTVVSGAAVPSAAQAVELDSGGFEAFAASDFAED